MHMLLEALFNCIVQMVGENIIMVAQSHWSKRNGFIIIITAGAKYFQLWLCEVLPNFNANNHNEVSIHFDHTILSVSFNHKAAYAYWRKVWENCDEEAEVNRLAPLLTYPLSSFVFADIRRFAQFGIQTSISGWRRKWRCDELRRMREECCACQSDLSAVTFAT